MERGTRGDRFWETRGREKRRGAWWACGRGKGWIALRILGNFEGREIVVKKYPIHIWVMWLKCHKPSMTGNG